MYIIVNLLINNYYDVNYILISYNVCLMSLYTSKFNLKLLVVIIGVSSNLVRVISYDLLNLIYFIIIQSYTIIYNNLLNIDIIYCIIYIRIRNV